MEIEPLLLVEKSKTNDGAGYVLVSGFGAGSGITVEIGSDGKITQVSASGRNSESKLAPVEDLIQKLERQQALLERIRVLTN